jgi:hypothetical protein
MTMALNGHRPTTAMRVKYLLEQGYEYHEIITMLTREGLSRNAIDCAFYRLRNGRFRRPFQRYCPRCLRPTVENFVCTSCGYETAQDTPLRADVGYSEPTSLARRDRGLGNSAEQDNALIMWLRRENGYRNGEGLTYFNYNRLAMNGDDAFTRATLKDVFRLGHFRDRDFEVTEAAARLVRRLCKKALLRYSELTRSVRRRIVVEVLREMLENYGPNRVTLDPSVQVLSVEAVQR